MGLKWVTINLQSEKTTDKKKSKYLKCVSYHPSIHQRNVSVTHLCEVMHNSWNYFKGHCVKNVEVFEKSERKNPGLQAFTDFQKKITIFTPLLKLVFKFQII